MNCRVCDHKLSPDKARCTNCGANNITTPLDNDVKKGSPLPGEDADGTISLNRVKSEDAVRIQCGPWDHMWGTTIGLDGTSISGVVQTSTTLIAGSPGAGKTTLLLGMSSNIAMTLKGSDVTLYIAAEQSLAEIRLTADRLDLDAMKYNLLPNGDSRVKMVSAMGGTANVGNILKSRKPRFVVLDSLQGLCGKDDAMQIEVCDIVKKYAVELKAPIVMISQVTKDGVMAGLMTLQHHVDTTMTIFPDEELIIEVGKDSNGNPMMEAVRVQEVMKNRFGRAFITQEYMMTEKGLKIYTPPDDEEDEEYDDEDEEEDEE
jgi:DNA repair protein RadA/Sms